MLTKEISEVEKGCMKHNSNAMSPFFCNPRALCSICQAKLSTLKSAQAKFDKFVEDLKKRLRGSLEYNGHLLVYNIIDELSSKQEEKEWNINNTT